VPRRRERGERGGCHWVVTSISRGLRQPNCGPRLVRVASTTRDPRRARAVTTGTTKPQVTASSHLGLGRFSRTRAGSSPHPTAAVGRAGAADGRQPAVSIGQSRCIDPQVSSGLVRLARAIGGAEVPLQRRGHRFEAGRDHRDPCAAVDAQVSYLIVHRWTARVSWHALCCGRLGRPWCRLSTRRLARRHIDHWLETR
jgi:hypothetical protein